jgi:hypothetical protein
MHAFITLHWCYRGSPPPGLRPQRFGSWLSYYGSSAISRRALTIFLRWVRSIWGELDRTRLLNLRSNPQDLPSLLRSSSLQK